MSSDLAIRHKPEAPTTAAVYVDQEAEEAILGLVMIGTDGTSVIEKLMSLGLRPHHFWTERYERVFSAMVALAERQAPVDTITLRIELTRMFGDERAARVEMDLVSQMYGSVGNIAAYVERVMEMHRERVTQTALLEALGAQGRGDREGVGRALEALNQREVRKDSLSPHQWAEVICEYLEKPEGSGFVPMPFTALTQAMGGGILPGELALISGATSHGKSVYADQWLDSAAKAGARAHLYMTEMTAAQRGLRYISRRTGIPFGKLRSRKLTSEDWQRVMKELTCLPYGCSIVSGWDIEDVVRDALHARFDFVVIDLIHGFHYEDERGLDRLVKAAQRLSRVSTTRGGYDGTAVVIVAHLSGAQNKGQTKRPQPALSSLKGSTSLSQDPDFVTFVWQEDDAEGLPTGEGKIWIPKARSGQGQTVPVRLNPKFLRFEVMSDS